jgi:hypothetical protein
LVGAYHSQFLKESTHGITHKNTGIKTITAIKIPKAILYNCGFVVKYYWFNLSELLAFPKPKIVAIITVTICYIC